MSAGRKMKGFRMEKNDWIRLKPPSKRASEFWIVLPAL